jgi:hypothetical protein
MTILKPRQFTGWLESDLAQNVTGLLAAIVLIVMSFN